MNKLLFFYPHTSIFFKFCIIIFAFIIYATKDVYWFISFELA